MARQWREDGIGNYVHYRFSQYKRLGISQYSDEVSDTSAHWAEIRKQQLSLIASKVNKNAEAEIAEIEQYYNYFYHPEKIENAELRKLAEQIRQETVDNYLKLVKNYMLNPDTGGVLSTPQAIKAYMQSISQEYEGQINKARLNVATLRAKVDRLKEIQNKELNLSESSKNDLKQAITTYSNKITSIVEEAKNLGYYTAGGNKYDGSAAGIIQTGKLLNNVSISQKTGKYIGGAEAKLVNRIIQLDKTVEVLLRAYSPSSTALGIAGELTALGVSALKCQAPGMITKEVETLLKFQSHKSNSTPTKLVGTLTRAGTINAKNFGVTITNNDFSLKLDAKEQKTDVVLTGFGSSEIKTSVKNYNLSASSTNEIGLLSGASLVYYLQDMNHKAVTHYMNLYSTRADNSMPTIRSSAIDAISLHLLYKAMSGNTAGNRAKGAADVIIINDNKSDRVKVYSIPSLVVKIAETQDKINIMINETTPLKDYKIPNIWVGSSRTYSQANAKTRIVNMLSQMHAAKIRVAVSKSVI